MRMRVSNHAGASVANAVTCCVHLVVPAGTTNVNESEQLLAVLGAWCDAEFQDRAAKVQLLNAKPENVRTEAQVGGGCRRVGAAAAAGQPVCSCSTPSRGKCGPRRRWVGAAAAAGQLLARGTPVAARGTCTYLPLFNL
jgi:hypothetical protein